VTTRQLVLICTVAAVWAVNFGVGSQAVSHWLNLHDTHDTVIGLVHAAYYLGVATVAMLVPRITRRCGLACASYGMALSAASLAVFPMVSGAAGWAITRFLSGAGCAMSLVPLEAFLSQRSQVKRRTETFAYYAVALTLAGALGIAFGNECFDAAGIVTPFVGDPRNAFFLGAIFPLIGSMIVHQTLAHESWHGEKSAERFRIEWKRHFLSFGTAWGQGFLEGGLLAFLSLYLVAQGMSASSAGGLMGVTMVGVIVFQVPVGWLADRLGRVPVLLGCYGIVIAGLVFLPWCDSLVVLGFWLFALGACSGAMYPLGLSLLGDKLGPGALARAYAWYLAMECVGSQMGAAAMGRARDVWSGSAMFSVGAAALVLVMLVYGGTQFMREKTVEREVERKAA
jgi:MFS family permease